MGLTLLGATVDTSVVAAAKAAADQALAAAEAAMDRANNARGMVLSDRERNAETIAPLKEAAARLGSTTAAADAIHAELAERIAAANQRVDGLSTDLTTEVQARAAADEAMGKAVAGLQANQCIVGYGTKAMTGSLLGGAMVSAVVPLSRNMGAADYSVGHSLVGGQGLLGNLSVVGVTAQTATTVTVSVKNGGLAAVANLSAAVVHVVAVRGGV